MNGKINIDTILSYWRKGAAQSLEIAEYLFKGKKYSACLFFCHLTLEKALKALIVAKTKKHAPYIHELDRLANKIKLDLTTKQIQDLKIITTFNIQARYDSIKFSFHKKCTADYTKKYLEITRQLYLWLKKQFPKK